MPSTSWSSAPGTPAWRCPASSPRLVASTSSSSAATAWAGDGRTAGTSSGSSPRTGRPRSRAGRTTAPIPDGFMSRDEITARVARYAEVVARAGGARDRGAAPDPARRGGFHATTSRGELYRPEVVVATGSYHAPRIPRMAEHISERVTQLHSHDYRNEAALPQGAVLVVGSGQTGLQLAEELFAAGRTVYISVGSAGRDTAPLPRPRHLQLARRRPARRRRARRDAAHRRPAPRPRRTFQRRCPRSPAMPVATTPTCAGTRPRGCACRPPDGADGERLTFAGDLALSLEGADRFFDERFRPVIDTYIERAAVSAPPDDRMRSSISPRADRAEPAARRDLDDHLGHRIRAGLRVDRRADPRRARLSAQRPRGRRRPGPVLPRPPLAALAGVGLAGRPGARRSAPRGVDGPGAREARSAIVGVIGDDLLDVAPGEGGVRRAALEMPDERDQRLPQPQPRPRDHVAGSTPSSARNRSRLGPDRNVQAMTVSQAGRRRRTCRSRAPRPAARRGRAGSRWRRHRGTTRARAPTPWPSRRSRPA